MENGSSDHGEPFFFVNINPYPPVEKRRKKEIKKKINGENKIQI